MSELFEVFIVYTLAGGVIAVPIFLIWLIVDLVRRRPIARPAWALAITTAGVLVGPFLASLVIDPVVLKSTTVTVRAADGGTIRLTGGSSVTIPPGFLAADRQLTLSLLEQPAAALIDPAMALQPQGAILVLEPGAGRNSRRGPLPALLAWWHDAWPGGSVAWASPAPSTPALEVRSGLDLVVRLEQPAEAASSGTIPAVRWEPAGSEPVVAGLPGSCTADGRSCQVSLPAGPASFRSVSVFKLGLNPRVARAPLPTRGAMIWQGGQWVPGTAGFDPAKPTVVLVHGMRSDVRTAFPCVQEFAGPDTQVLGFSYDWSNGLEESGQQLASFLDRLKAAGLKRADVRAHSEGVPVTLAALGRTALPIDNAVLLGGPIMGTPAADFGALSQTLVRSAPRPFWATVLMHTPAAQLGGLGDLTLNRVVSGQFVNDLAYGSPVLAEIRQKVSRKMADPGSNLAGTRLIPVAGTDHRASPDMQKLGRALAYAGGGLPVENVMDGIIWVDSALGVRSGLKLTHTPRRVHPVSHTDLQCSPDVIADVAAVLKPPPETAQKPPPETVQKPPDTAQRQPAPPLAFTAATALQATAGQPFSFSFCDPRPSGTALCGAAGSRNPSGGSPPYTFLLSQSTMPPGLRLAVTGRLSGTPSASAVGRHRFTVCALDREERSVCRPVTLTVSAPASAQSLAQWENSSWKGTYVVTSGEGRGLRSTVSFRLGQRQAAAGGTWQIPITAAAVAFKDFDFRFVARGAMMQFDAAMNPVRLGFTMQEADLPEIVFTVTAAVGRGDTLSPKTITGTWSTRYNAGTFTVNR